MRRNAFFKAHIHSTRFRSLCEITREIYWSTKDPVIREKALAVRWKANQIDRRLKKLSRSFKDPEHLSSVGKKSRPMEVVKAITAKRLKLFEEEGHKGMQNEDYLNYKASFDPNKTIYELLGDLYEVSGDERVKEAEYIVGRMLTKIDEYRQRRDQLDEDE
jgi:hypothetical protein